ncbi:MAG TPA: class I SAM-dependent methyltransferase [Thermoanaerobaculia bacterium]|jgi:2-polyprenyl-6-hydroxyphenyl methylase/3-demethylubiquinone-9 3-methyltransferase
MTEYAYSSSDPTWSNSYLWPELLRIARHLAPPPRAVFELGCGNGATARFLAQQGYSVTGVDPSQSGVAIAQQFASERLRFEVGSTADDLAGRFGSFPLVVSLEVIEHCPSAREFMRAFTSVLAPGGVGIISTPYHGYVKNLAVTALGRFDHHFDPLWEGGHLKFFTIRKLRDLFREFGFEEPEFHRVGRVPVLAKSVIAVVRRGETL